MIPNNNLSVLPIYDSIEQQNAKKWWIYGKVYPLFTPAGFLLPFQFQRERRTVDGQGAVMDFKVTSGGSLIQDGTQIPFVDNCVVVEYNISSTKVYLVDIPAAKTDRVMAIAYGASNEVLEVLNPITQGTYTGIWELPSGTKSIKVQIENHDSTTAKGVVKRVKAVPMPISKLHIYDKQNNLIEDCSNRISDFGFFIRPFPYKEYDVVIFLGQLPVFTYMNNGQYYLKLGDEVQEWYSEIFTVVNDISGYLKLEWWDIEDFEMDAGTIVYENTQFKNILYLCSDIAKPEYIFDEEVIERDGYMFPVKQISEKKYRFSFLASEYLLDVMRFIRMSDYICITKDGQTYNVDSFLISPEWEDNGDIATVDAEFETATVAKKIGRGVAPIQKGGDYNEDYNNDYTI